MFRMTWRRGLVVVLGAFAPVFPFRSFAQNPEIHNFRIQEVNIDSRSDSVVSGTLGSRLYIPAAALEKAPNVLGFPDPLKYLQALPGVQTTSEIQSGLFVDGTDNSHTQVQIDGAPIYNASHLLGMYSTFNNYHFGLMEFSKSAGTSNNRLGGLVVMRTDTVRPQKISARLSAGLIGSQANVRMPLLKNSVLSVSARATYLNFLYGGLLEKSMDDASLVYGFQDVNASWTSRFGPDDVLRFNFFAGRDKARLRTDGNDMDALCRWNNTVASAMWEHKTGNGHLNQSIYSSSYFCRLETYSYDRAFSLPGGISDCSYELEGMENIGGNILNYGAKVSKFGFEESLPEISGSGNAGKGHGPGLNSWSFTAHANMAWNLNRNNTFETSVLGSRFIGNGAGDRFAGLDPSFSLTHSFAGQSGSILKIEAGISHQYLHLFGYTSNGLPTEFWLPSDNGIKPESSKYCSVYYEGGLFNQKINISAGLYCKSLENLVEFNNNMTDVYFENYSMRNGLLTGSGHSYGFNLMVRKDWGRWNGWISYAYGRAFTRIDGAEKYTPTYYDRPHDLNVRLNWKPGSKWTFSADGMFCSGTPFSMPRYIYLLNESVVVEYGEHNNARLPANWRVDLAADWIIKHDEKCSYGLNFSLYNALFNGNVMYYYFSRVHSAGAYKMKSLIVAPICVPSISFHVEL